MIRVEFAPSGRMVEVAAGRRVIDIARGVEVGIVASCGGKGRCGKCRVLFERDASTDGALSAAHADERDLLPDVTRDQFVRLACRTRIFKDATVMIPEESQARDGSLRKPVYAYDVTIEPAVSRVIVELGGRPGRRSTAPLVDRVRARLSERLGKSMDGPDLSAMGVFSREAVADRVDAVTATLSGGRRIVQLRPGAHEQFYGMAFDIGTTSIAGFLCDLSTGRTLASAVLANPQRTYGADVVSRIAQVQNAPSSLKTLQRAVVSTLNRLIKETAAAEGVAREDIVDVVAVGNPTMQHLFLGLNPQSIGQAPYVPFCHEGGDMPARELGLGVAPSAFVHVLPMISGFIGGDTIAALLTGAPEDFQGVKLMIDVGTNGEVVLSKRGELWVTSCATGPAFEGAQIECGMLATSGAIEKVWIDNGSLHYSVIGQPGAIQDEKPAGLCGSGVISAVATLVDAGIVQKSGAFDPDATFPGVRRGAKSGKYEMLICPASESSADRDIVITQGDIRAVQLGKAAVYAAVELLMKEAGVTDLERIFLAGTFGNYLDPDDLVRLGMLSTDERLTIDPIGNAAGDGARMALFNSEKRLRAVEIARDAHAIELSLRSDFQDSFVEAIRF